MERLEQQRYVLKQSLEQLENEDDSYTQWCDLHKQLAKVERKIRCIYIKSRILKVLQEVV